MSEARSTPPRLPAELTDTIIDLLHDEEDALANCSLVCKAWLPATRYHIFENLLLDPWNTEAFIDMKNHPLATVAPYIHHLTIDQIKHRYHQTLNNVFVRLPNFPILQRLDLKSISWGRIGDEARNTAISAFKGVTELELSFSDFTTPDQFIELVSNLTSLRSLSVQYVSWTEDTPVTFSQQNAPPKLHVIKLGGLGSGPILDWLAMQKPIIDTLSICLIPEEADSVNRYLGVLGPSLLHLSVHLHSSIRGGALVLVVQ